MLRRDSPAMPRDMVDLDSEPSCPVSTVEVQPMAITKVDANLRLEHNPVGGERSEQSDLEIGILRLVPRRPVVQHAAESPDPVSAGPGKPPSAGVQGRSRRESPIDELLEDGFEIMVVEKPGKVDGQPHGTQNANVVIARHPVGWSERGGAVHDHVLEFGWPGLGHHVDRTCRHPTKP
jgi:hypothetical protein